MKVTTNSNLPNSPRRLPAAKDNAPAPQSGDKVQLSRAERIALARATDPVLNGMRAGFLGAGAGALAGPMTQGLGLWSIPAAGFMGGCAGLVAGVSLGMAIEAQREKRGLEASSKTLALSVLGGVGAGIALPLISHNPLVSGAVFGGGALVAGLIARH
ncbi:hypothetical protein JST97_20605 [bacterium]|nr:hypothetical protein [bacterium]